jgi:hypothetical protein
MEGGGGQDRTETEEVEEVFGSLRYLYFWTEFCSPRRYSVVAPRSDELGKTNGGVYRWIVYW